MYGNDPEIFSISTIKKVPDIRNDFWNDVSPLNQKPWKFYNLRNRKNLRITKWKLEILLFS